MTDHCDLPTFYSYSEPVARRQHVCCECDAPILVGEKHFRGTGKWGDDKPRTYRQHTSCMEACMLLRDDFNGGDCIGFGSLKEEFDEMRCDNWHPKSDRFKPQWIKLRHLMAAILWRERKARTT